MAACGREGRVRVWCFSFVLCPDLRSYNRFPPAEAAGAVPPGLLGVEHLHL